MPSIFPNLPSYLPKETPARRSGSATVKRRSEKVECNLVEKEKLKDEHDKVKSIEDLLSKLDKNLLPDNMLEHKIGESIFFFSLSIQIKQTISFCNHLIPVLSFKMKLKCQYLNCDILQGVIIFLDDQY